jgi:predicted acyltransferase
MDLSILKSPDLSQIETFHVRNKTILSNERVFSIDALRGFDMFWIMGGNMIFRELDIVFDNKISTFVRLQMSHTAWLGFNFYDIIMPLFLFIVGASMVYSFRKRLSSGDTDNTLWKHTIKRIIILWILGMAVQGNLLSYDISKIKLYSNTLQAIAVAYLLATVFILYLPVIYQIIGTIGLLMGYWAIVALVPIFNNSLDAYSMYTNVPNFFDQYVLGRFDDGLEYSWIISSLNFAATTMLGVFCGYMMQSNTNKSKKLSYFLLFGLSLIYISLVLDHWHPIIKKIWTSSFVLFSGGICVLLLALFYLLIDILKIRRGTKWMMIIGSNAIFGYVTWQLFNKSFLYAGEVIIIGLKPYIGNWYNSLNNLSGFLVIYFIMYYMYKGNFFIKI